MKPYLVVKCSVLSDGVSRFGLGLETRPRPRDKSEMRQVSRPIFASIGLEGFRSRDFEYCKEMVC